MRKFYTAKKNIPLFEAVTEVLNEEKAERVIQAGGVWCDRKRLTEKNQLVLAGATLQIMVHPKQGQRYQIPKEHILFDHSDFLIIYKPPMLTTVSDRTNLYWNLSSGVADYFKSVGLNYRPTAITRLDYLARGLVIFPKNKSAEKQLFQLSEGRKIKKRYFLKTEDRKEVPLNIHWRKRGSLSWTLLDFPIAFVEKARVSLNAGSKKGVKSAQSLIIKGGNTTSYYATLITGRRHQLRCHLSHAIAPILGDELYGARRWKAGEGIGLVATSYQWTWKKRKIKCQLPTSFYATIEESN